MKTKKHWNFVVSALAPPTRAGVRPSARTRVYSTTEVEPYEGLTRATGKARTLRKAFL